MNASQLFEDISANCLTEVSEAATSYYDSVKGLTVRQQFFIYPDGKIVCLNSSDSSNSTIVLQSDDEATFQHIHSRYFN